MIDMDAKRFLEYPDVQGESGLNTYYSRDLVLEMLDAAIDAALASAPAQAISAVIADNARMIARNEELIARNNAMLGDYSPSRLSAHAAPMSMSHADKINDFRMQYATLAVEVRKQEKETGYTNYRAATAMRRLNTAITGFISARQDSFLSQNYEREVQASLQKVTAIILA